MLTNTQTSYGSIARLFHWAIALLIVTAIALALYAESLPRDAQSAGTLQTLFSLHKTIGVSVFFLALARILWALLNPHPAPLHPEKRLETFAAEVVHFALYGAMVIMPLSGWILHAAESGFAPILWPFGQSLPFVPKSEAVAHTAQAVHKLSAIVIYVTVGLHVAGALKHLIIDRDKTVARMTRGVSAGQPGPRHAALAPAGAIAIWIVIVLAGLLSAAQPHTDTPKAAAPAQPATAPAQQATAPATPAKPATTTAPAATPDTAGWTVTQGKLGFDVQQMGAPVSGTLPDWSADITYDPETGLGAVSVIIDTTTLTLGSVTDQAKGPEFFQTETYPQAILTADISREGDGPQHIARGTLELAGVSAPVVLTFTLTIEGNTAQMQGTAQLDRRDWDMGTGYSDETTVGFPVTVTVDLTATR
ncbi:cytochrome B [Thioclava sp. SK-1]|uniref:cytochrome b/b6 domain-containing protein n=1 Tax=Thioclava sp. SK-1 TaxID=1889770 RepID=UPI0008264E32|nr:cytochrome b/b6 domain-containing protein [Thioclava sp. SK-1]OCX67056.1 cytochrome B [Thioclava sp. SK-1]